MNEPIQINVKITADKPLIKILEALVAALGSKPSAQAPGKATETPQGPAGAEEAAGPLNSASSHGETPQLKGVTPAEPQDDDPGFDTRPLPIDHEMVLRLAQDCKKRGVPAEDIRATVASFGATRPHDVPKEKLPELFDALNALLEKL